MRCEFSFGMPIEMFMLLLLLTLLPYVSGQLRVKQLSPTLVRSTVTLTDFTKIEGNCPGNYLNSSQTDIYSCADQCRFSPACLGFTYNFATNGCYLKQVDCDNPSVSNPYVNFFRKAEIFNDTERCGKCFFYSYSHIKSSLLCFNL